MWRKNDFEVRVYRKSCYISFIADKKKFLLSIPMIEQYHTLSSSLFNRKVNKIESLRKIHLNARLRASPYPPYNVKNLFSLIWDSR